MTILWWMCTFFLASTIHISRLILTFKFWSKLWVPSRRVFRAIERTEARNFEALMGGEICKFQNRFQESVAADSAAALSPPGPSHFRHGRPLDFQLTLAGHLTSTKKVVLNDPVGIFSITSKCWGYAKVYVEIRVMQKGWLRAEHLRTGWVAYPLPNTYMVIWVGAGG